MKKAALFLSALSISALSFAQVFEGSIAFKMEKKTDTTRHTYFVKGNLVKLDEKGKKTGKEEGSFIFDLTAKTVKFLNPQRKVWGEQKNEILPAIKGTAVVEKTKNVKTLVGYKCTEYTVTCADENKKISYWIYSPDKKGKKFDFFAPMIELWKRKDPASTYWLQIKNLPAGSMPMMSIETNISDGKQTGKLEVLKVEAKVIPASEVSVPAEYKKFEQ
ncbi:MAG: DUF4412 domain-containing protein [Bacteroidia bacterium]|nr:DUF4412 domain-containing protein [Bacteroidia bacterium]